MVQDKEVIVLIDCGATHNYIHQKWVEQLRLLFTKTSNYEVVAEYITIRHK